MNLQIYKGKHKAAKQGYDLLKKKADALKVLVFVLLSWVYRILHYRLAFEIFAS